MKSLLDAGLLLAWVELELSWENRQTREFDRGYQHALKKLKDKIKRGQFNDED